MDNLIEINVIYIEIALLLALTIFHSSLILFYQKEKLRKVSAILLFITSLIISIYGYLEMPKNDVIKYKCDNLHVVKKIINTNTVQTDQAMEVDIRNASIGDEICIKGEKVKLAPYLTESGWLTKEEIIKINNELSKK